MVAPYRVSFYEKLSGFGDDFKVFHHLKKAEDGRPHHNKKVKFATRGFSEYKISFMGFSLLLVNGMFKAITVERPELIIMPGIPGNLTYRRIAAWAHNNNIRILFWYCGWEPNRKRSLMLREIKKKLSLAFYRKGDYFITYSTKAKEDLLNQKFNPEIIKIALNGIELDGYTHDNIAGYVLQSKSLRKELNPQNDVVYLYVGGLMDEKRVDFLVGAFIEFRLKNSGAQLWIIGDGPGRKKTEGMIEGMPFIKYFGRIIDNVEPYFVAADYFVLPGTGGLAINQAMFFETPCIVGRADGTEKDLVIDDVTGFNFSEDDRDSLISKLEKTYYLDQHIKNKMKKNCREFIVKKSNVNNMISTFGEVLSEISCSN